MSGMGVFVLMVVAMCATWRGAEGAAFFVPISSETTMYGSRPVVRQFCEWEGKKMMIGSSWKTTDCLSCSCSDTGLFCSGGGVYAPIPGCMVLIDETCRAQLVDSNDPYQDCGHDHAITG
ncbi:Hypp7464 [Branchiostoma lanceolatum]|uniref:Hypp7464 protein n=1 Tax=Branchiostoma lanceolatum TaxID=7740 RepID=A0A8J9Z157_BRALA|nr:Hypp7464 [Branchiostoma lanceolatum]